MNARLETENRRLGNDQQSIVQYERKILDFSKEIDRLNFNLKT
jgi:hypothetical protein